MLEAAPGATGRIETGESMASAGLIDDYVRELGRELRGPRRARHDMIVEARDSLVDTAEALEASGMSRAEAESLAVAEFGPVEEIAPGYQEELLAGQGRRTAALLFLSVPLVTLMWSLIWRFWPEIVTMSPVEHKPWWFLPVARALDIAQILTGLVAAVALVTLGRGTRRRFAPRARTVTRALGLLVWCQLPFTTGMSIALMSAGHTGFGTYVPGVVASVLSCGMQAWQLHSAARCLALSRRPRPALA